MLLRTLLMILPAIIVTIIEMVIMVVMAVRQFGMYVFNKPNKLTVQHEWHYFKVSVYTWYQIWLHGFGEG
jgi:hypothetical protein